VNPAFGELYTYDGLNQLATFQRGTLNSTKTGLTGSATASQSWTPDALGNFTSITTNGTNQTRTANQQNEITSVSGATTPAYDAAGEMTTDETGLQYVYDAWGVRIRPAGTRPRAGRARPASRRTPAGRCGRRGWRESQPGIRLLHRPSAHR
jgi:hypothetical protein